MKRYIFLILLIFNFVYLNSQIKRHSKLFLKNGDTLKVKGRLLDDKFIYKENKDNKEISLDIVDYIEQINGLDRSVETFKQFKLRNSDKKVLLKERIKGEIGLYTERFVHHAGFNSAPMVYVSYYLNKRGDEEVISVDGERYFRANFYKAAALYFEDCPSLVEKLQKKVFKRRHIEDIVYFYNNNCVKDKIPK